MLAVVQLGGRYRVVRTIKRGGMAEVLEGVLVGENDFEVPVAIKRLLPEIAAEESSVRSFIDEARIVSRLSHANVVRVFDFGLWDGQPFQAMELVDGIDLVELSRR